MVSVVKEKLNVRIRKGLSVRTKSKNDEKKRTKVPLADRRKRYGPVRRSKVRQVKFQISVIKREGGTVKFAKRLRAIRKQTQSKLKSERSLVLKKQKSEKNKAAAAAVKGKTTKDGKKVKVVLKKQHKYDVKKMRKSYKTQLAPRKLPSKNFFKDMRTSTRRKYAYLRRSLLAGTVCIMLAGRYQCKRVIFLKQLKRSGLCLVTGPFGVNSVPLRRVNQNFLIATSVRIKLDDLKVPKHINDSYFKKDKVVKKKKGTEEDIFESKKKTKKGPSVQRKQDQKDVDSKIVQAIKQRKDKKVLLKYLATDFGLIGKRYVHRMNF